MDQSKEISCKCIVEAFYKHVIDETTKSPIMNQFHCRLCEIENRSKVFHSNVGKDGYNNLSKHIYRAHKDTWQGEYNKVVEVRRSGGILSYFDSERNNRAQAVYSWMRLIVENNLAFSTVENQIFRDSVKFAPISIKFLMKWMKAVGDDIMQQIKAELPDYFGLIIDGWSNGATEHFIAIYAVYSSKDGEKQESLLSMSTLINETNQSGQNHADQISDVLQMYGKTLSSVQFLVADNTNLNPAIVKIMNEMKKELEDYDRDNQAIAFVNCHSHLLNLACNAVADSKESTLKKVEKVMHILRTNKCAGRLRMYTKLKGKGRNKTRWSSMYAMLKRFFELNELEVDGRMLLSNHYFPELFLLDYDFDDGIDKVRAMPTTIEIAQLTILFKQLQMFNKAQQVLQHNSCTFKNARDVFTKLLKLTDIFDVESMRKMAQYLSFDPRINKNIRSPDFCNAIYKLQSDLENELTAREANSVKSFFIISDESSDESEDSDDHEQDLFESFQSSLRRQHEKKSRVEAGTKYRSTVYIPPTSNSCERFFSRAKLVFSERRKSMFPINLEIVLYLHAHNLKWGFNTLFRLMNDDALKEVDEEENEEENDSD